MKPSSPDSASRRTGPPSQARRPDPRSQALAAGLSDLPTSQTGVVGRDVRIRPARLDRQLGQGKIEAGYSDTHLEAAVQRAAQQARESARAEGYAAGWAQGRQAAAEQLREDQAALLERMAAQQEAQTHRIRSLVTQLSEAIVAARRAAIPDWEEVADVLADGALRIARAALARELHSIDEPVAVAVRQALESIADPGEAVVHLHPDDAAVAGTALPEGIRIVPDPTVPAGGVVVLTPSQRLRLDLPTALAAAERVLRS